MRKVILIVILSVLYSPFRAQVMDSLKLVLKSAKHDTVRCETLIQIIENENDDLIWPAYNDQLQLICEKNLKTIKTSDPLYFFYTKHLASVFNNKGYLTGAMGEPKQSIEYNQKSVDILQKLLKSTKSLALQKEIKRDLATSLNNIASAYKLKGDVAKTIECLTKSLELQHEVDDKEGEARSLSNLAYIYDQQGDIPKSLEYNHKSLKIKEAIGDKDGIAYSFNNMGTIYLLQNDYKKALDYFNKAYALQVEVNNKNGAAQTLNNIGYLYFNEGNLKLALEYYEKSLTQRQLLQDKQGIAETMINIGGLYQKITEQKEWKNNKKAQDSLNNKALDYFKDALAIQQISEDKKGASVSMINMAEILFAQGEFKLAEENGLKGLKLSQEIGFPDNIRHASAVLSRIYEKKGNYKEAFEMVLLHKLMSDSISNENTKRASLQKSFQYEYDKKAAADSVRVEEERKVVTAQLKQEKTQRFALYAGIALITIFSAFMYNRFRVTRKQKFIIEDQKVEVDKQRELADSRRIIAEEQHHIIEEKQKEILDSIHYAKRIQQALLTGESYISEYFGAECFILYQPKDIVSGDFYWAAAQHNKFYIATADCTGHGVPGAFMSLLNINFLNENVIERGIELPGNILTEQRKEIIKALNPKGDENSKDGMDCVLCAFDLKNNQLDFAAANNPLWLVRNNELTEFKADKMPVGKGEDNAMDFRNQNIQLEKGDIIYTFTDGYADQFGGPKGKKFKYKQLEEVILANTNKPMQEQKDALLASINQWKGEQEQVDDILVIGVRV
ncbi:MAG: tetratricopeptide repeat protein [Bacteroidota bacterium]|nr:tetratricopeptide repeat protein [Bacteroidota bacterium]